MATLIAKRSAKAGIKDIVIKSACQVFAEHQAEHQKAIGIGPGEVQTFVLPWPASVNALYRSVGGRVQVSAAARAWKAQAAALLSCLRCVGVSWPLTGRLGIVIEAWPPNRRARDLDNLIKVTLDAGNGLLWHDDAQIDDIRIVRMDVDPDRAGFVRFVVFAL